MARGGEATADGPRSYLVGSVNSAVRLLAALRDRPSLAVKESAELLGVAPSTAHRLLSTLQVNGFVAQDPATRRYGPGPALLGVALASLRRVDVRRVARPHLSALSAETRETVSLGVAEGATLRIIDSVEGTEVVRVSARTGEVVPAHLSAAGKVLLSRLSREELYRLLPAQRLSGRVGRPAVPRSSLVRELEEVRRRGYATSFEESAPGLSAVGVGVRDLHGRMLAAISVSLPAERLDPERAAVIAAATQNRAARIEEELGAPPRSWLLDEPPAGGAADGGVPGAGAADGGVPGAGVPGASAAEEGGSAAPAGGVALHPGGAGSGVVGLERRGGRRRD